MSYLVKYSRCCAAKQSAIVVKIIPSIDRLVGSTALGVMPVANRHGLGM